MAQFTPTRRFEPLILLALFIATLLSLTGCSSYGPKTPLVIVPNQKDWETALGTLRPEEEAALERCNLIVDASAVTWDGNIYQYKYGPPNGHPIDFMRLDLPAICHSYAQCLPAQSHKTWKLFYAGTFCGYGNEDEIPSHESCSFKLDWQFSGPDGSVTLSERGYARTTRGDGLNLLANQAFAQAFLRLMLDLERGK